MSSRKTPILAISLFLVLICLSSGPAWAEEPAATPQKSATPAGLVSESRPEQESAEAEVPEAILAALKQVNQGGKRSRRSKVEAAHGGVIKVTPGRNVTLTVAGDQLNRIVTPFSNPLVHTVSKAKVNVDGSVVYVSLAMEDGPSTMFITENGESDPSISLTLTPAAVSPREIRLTLAGNPGIGAAVSLSGGKSAKWEKSQPYTAAIEKVMLSTGRGEVPPGYNLRNFIAQDPAPRCRLAVRVEPRQVLEGHNFLVVISRLTNISSSQLMMDESACYEEGVRAVAVWPRVSLAPRQSTELYVVYQREMGQKPGKRPSVLLPRPAEPVCDSEPPEKARPRSRPGAIAVSEAAPSPRTMSAYQP